MKKVCHAPDHFAFYKENNFGAVLGRDDYFAIVIVLEDAIDKVDFLY